MRKRSRRRDGGPRFTRPAVRAAEIADGSVYDDRFVAELQSRSAADRLQLGGVERQPLPPALENLEYVCDQEDLSAFAGMLGFMRFAYGLGLADWVAGLPLERRRDALYGAGKLCEVLVAIFAAGLERVSHIDDVKDDPGLCAALGLDRLPDQATLSRFFSDATAAGETFLRSTNRRFSEASAGFERRAERLLVDVDTRDVGVYGKQEGAVCSPRKGGRPIYTFEVMALRNGRDILDGGLLQGATHPAPLFAERFASVLAQLAPQTRELIVCADAAWYADHVLERIESADADGRIECACKYAIRAQMRGRLKAIVAGLEQSAWVRYDEETEVAEVEFAFTQARDAAGKLRHKPCVRRRYVVTRRRLADRSDAEQGVLLEVPRYEYRAIVTNLDWRAGRVLSCYNRRATVESILKEGALGFHMDSLPSASFAGNAVYCQLLILAYNLVNLFRRLCAPAEGRRQQVRGLRRRLLAVPGRIALGGDGCRVRCSATGPHLGWLEQLRIALLKWLPPSSCAPQAAGAG